MHMHCVSSLLLALSAGNLGAVRHCPLQRPGYTLSCSAAAVRKHLRNEHRIRRQHPGCSAQHLPQGPPPGCSATRRPQVDIRSLLLWCHMHCAASSWHTCASSFGQACQQQGRWPTVIGASSLLACVHAGSVGASLSFDPGPCRLHHPYAGIQIRMTSHRTLLPLMSKVVNTLHPAQHHDDAYQAVLSGAYG